MKILVTCKRVPNPEHKLKIGGGKIDLAAASWQLNTFDEYAVETALRLTEAGKGGARSGEVVALSIGPKDVQQQLRGVLAIPGMGTGLGGVDPADAARAMVDELRAHRQPKPATVYLVDIDDEILLCLEEALRLAVG